MVRGTSTILAAATVVPRSTPKKKVIIIPGKGCTPIETSNWYSKFRDHVRLRCSGSSMKSFRNDGGFRTTTANVECDLYEFPDPYLCRESIWVPFVRSKIDHPSETIIVGHSIGAVCAMRLLEQFGKEGTPLRACILVAASYTDQNDVDERQSEYFNRPWDWRSIKRGSSTKTFLFHGMDDPLIPVGHARHIAKKLTPKHCIYFEEKKRSHYFRPHDELTAAIDTLVPWYNEVEVSEVQQGIIVR